MEACHLPKYYPASCSHGYLHMHRELLEIISVDFDAKGQILIIYSPFIQYVRQYGNKTKQCISYL